MCTRIGAACLILALGGARAAAITLRIPDTSFTAGTAGSTVYLPVLVDSIAVADSIGGFQFKLTCDTQRLRPIGVGDEGIVAGSMAFAPHGVADSTGFTVFSGGDGVTTMSGSGLLIQIQCEVVSDTAGPVPVTFVPGWTELSKFVGARSIRDTDVTTVNGTVTFIPTAALTIDSARAPSSTDTVITTAVGLTRVRGDQVRALHARFETGDSALLIVDVDTVGTLAGIFANGETARFTQSDGGRAMTIDLARGGAGALPDPATLVRLRLLARCRPRRWVALVADSASVTGFAEPFRVAVADAAVELDCATGVAEAPAGVAAGYRIYPNPATGRITVRCDRGPVGSIEIVDAVGRVVARVTAGTEGHEVSLSLSALDNGVYRVRERRGARMLGTIVVAR